MKCHAGWIVCSYVWPVMRQWAPQELRVFYRWCNRWLRIVGVKIGRGEHIYLGVYECQALLSKMDVCSYIENDLDCYSVDMSAKNRELS